MKVVYEGALFPGIGGGPRHFEGVSEALAHAGVEVTHVLPQHSAVEGHKGRFETFELHCGEGRTARQLRYELCRALLLVKWWVVGRRVDVWMARHSVLGVSLGLARLVSSTVVLEINGPVREEMQANFGSRAASILADVLMRAQVYSAHLVVAVTPGLAQYTSDRVPGRRCEVVANGASRDLVAAENRPADRHPVLLFAGALTPWYEVDVLLDAIRLLRDRQVPMSCLVLGDGVRRRQLAAQARALDIEHLVTFAGWVDGSEVRRQMQRADVGLLPLRPKHVGLEAVGSPLKLYEYVAAGLEVVGTDLDGVTNSPVRAAVHVYQQGDAVSCASAIQNAITASGRPLLDAETWSWDARAKRLTQLVERHRAGTVRHSV